MNINVTISLEDLCELRNNAQIRESDQEYISGLNEMLDGSRRRIGELQEDKRNLQLTLDQARYRNNPGPTEQQLQTELERTVIELKNVRRQLYANYQVPVGSWYAVLEKYGNDKVNVIKAVRAITGFGLKEAKDLVETEHVKLPWHGSYTDMNNNIIKLQYAGATANGYQEPRPSISEQEWSIVLEGLSADNT